MSYDHSENPHTAAVFSGFPPSQLMSCPMCNYPLQGLPATHACPERGFRYDEETKVWIGGVPVLFKLFWVCILGVCLVPVSGIGVSMLRNGSNLFSKPPLALYSMPVLSVAILGSFILGIIGHLYFRRKAPMAGLGPDGIFYRILGGKIRSIEWSDIRQVHVSKELIGYEVIIRLKQATGFPIQGAFGNSRDLLAFGEDANQRLNEIREDSALNLKSQI